MSRPALKPAEIEVLVPLFKHASNTITNTTYTLRRTEKALANLSDDNFLGIVSIHVIAVKRIDQNIYPTLVLSHQAGRSNPINISE